MSSTVNAPAQPISGTKASTPNQNHSLPFMIAAAVYAAITNAILIASVKATDGHFIYPLDDVYINMAMAKNVALHGVWGISPYQFTSSTSTPLFVLLLSAIYRVVGPSTYAPLLISWAFG